MKSFWTIRPAVQDAEGEWQPSFPAGFKSKWVNPCDIRILPAGDAPADHKHGISGTIALGSNHGHYVFYRENGAVYQEHFGGGTAHDHDEVQAPDYYMVFVVCTTAMAQYLQSEVPNIIVTGVCEITASEDGSGTIGDIINTTWDSAEREEWETRFANFGVTLPDGVTNDRRLTTWVLNMFHAPTQRIVSERYYRYTGVEIVDGDPEYEE